MGKYQSVEFCDECHRWLLPHEFCKHLEAKQEDDIDMEFAKFVMEWVLRWQTGYNYCEVTSSLVLNAIAAWKAQKAREVE
ncbi:MAG: hypothetical protein ACYTBJ_27400 [Planctomycetota bacterium]|jgi:hypothetical protein